MWFVYPSLSFFYSEWHSLWLSSSIVLGGNLILPKRFTICRIQYFMEFCLGRLNVQAMMYAQFASWQTFGCVLLIPNSFANCWCWYREFLADWFHENYLHYTLPLYLILENILKFVFLANRCISYTYVLDFMEKRMFHSQKCIKFSGKQLIPCWQLEIFREFFICSIRVSIIKF